MELIRPENPAMTFDEVSMERSKSFVKALQVFFYHKLCIILQQICFYLKFLRDCYMASSCLYVYWFLVSYLFCFVCGLLSISCFINELAVEPMLYKSYC